ncbi:MAG: type II toxin-antitoxin system RelE/ParE family toxin [Thermoprotei archaeon]|nr:type II toxin-antitoxin system RelE/ParE family toxin [Thermoprotei archaeon]
MRKAPFRVLVKRRAVRKLEELSEAYRNRVLKVLEILKANPLPSSHFDIKKLKGYQDTFRIRLGNIRIVYTIDWTSKRIIVHFIGPRGQAYK